MSIATIIPYIQITISVLIGIAVLLQHNSAGVGGAFGGSDSLDAGFHTRRGFEKFLFIGTLILAALFGITSLIAVIY
jgi:protein translocase SecG subunit